MDLASFLMGRNQTTRRSRARVKKKKSGLMGEMSV